MTAREWAGNRVPGLLVVAALVTAFLMATLPDGPPPFWEEPGSWKGLGHELDAYLPNQGLMEFTRIFPRPSGRALRVDAISTLGREIVSCWLNLIVLVLALVALRRWGPPSLTILPRRQDLPPLQNLLAWFVPCLILGALGAALLAARIQDGGPFKRVVFHLSLPQLASPRTAVWPILRMVILTPLAEECLWRGIVYLGLRRRLGPVAAAGVTAFLFGAWHLLAGWELPVALTIQLVFGLVACWLVEETRSLGAALLLHSVGNLVAIGLYMICMFAPGWPLMLFNVGV